MKKSLLWIGLILLFAAPLVIVLHGFARKVIVVPLMYIFWAGHHIFQSIPQSILWALFLAIAILTSLKSLVKPQKPNDIVKDVEKENLGQVSLWAERFHMKNEWTISRYLKELVVTALAYNRQQSHKKIREDIESGELDTSSEIQALLKLGFKRIPESSHRSFLRYLFRPRSRKKIALSLEFEPEKVVKFLENQLEIENEYCDRPVVNID
jgi:hypothetical protein